MNDTSSYVRLPAGLVERRLAVIPLALDDDEFAAQQIEFIKHVFGYCVYLREHARETPVSDAFLAVFVNLFEAIDANAPEDARRCATQLVGVLQVVFPGFDCDGLPSSVEA
jgi:hypothetical protein